VPTWIQESRGKLRTNSYAVATGSGIVKIAGSRGCIDFVSGDWFEDNQERDQKKSQVAKKTSKTYTVCVATYNIVNMNDNVIIQS